MPVLFYTQSIPIIVWAKLYLKMGQLFLFLGEFYSAPGLCKIKFLQAYSAASFQHVPSPPPALVMDLLAQIEISF